MKDLIKKRFLRAEHSYNAHAIIQNQMQDKLLSLLPKKSFDSIFEFGAGTGGFTQKITHCLQYERFLCNDIIDYAHHFPPQIEFFSFDMNEANLHLASKTFDLILSNACMQWLNQELFFKNLDLFSKKDSILAITCFGKENLYEIRELTGFGLPYLELACYEKFLKQNWKILHLFEERVCLSFGRALEVFSHLQSTGTNALAKDAKITKKTLQDLENKYHNTLTYHPIYLVAQRC
ncbi:methyltransferase domain-containing protein [Helicobacter mustelae]|uniref:Putative biotin synthesis protein n=1 Tax=Helicobacter mustelae (strain ATCC 43772 / CCUG 25715 / CIP 103759 / LMG 18044 / NCTC 12198 / R85-136P) TaxID=679897 RepID=D3UHA5_HELM1|nr:biotin synthesis protein [Helicobacter mustelae]CBG39877.1 putative biotin synthesis protein [Helicobacter mustelae 12198]SQH71387.1 biotin synthesis protein [Helicobacter mustelae]STP12515.1 biotin synthesis protein [Helicobacter mustelae]